MSLVETKVSRLRFYPVKSCGETVLQTAEVTEKGFKYDRHWMLVDANNRFLTQRELLKMALIKPVLFSDRIAVSSIGEPSVLELPLDNDGFRREVKIWRDTCEAVDEGDIAAQWFSDVLNISCRLVHLPDNFTREKRAGYGRLEFADGYPFLIVSEESLQDLNDRIQGSGGCSYLVRDKLSLIPFGKPPYGWFSEIATLYSIRANFSTSHCYSL